MADTEGTTTTQGFVNNDSRQVKKNDNSARAEETLEGRMPARPTPPLKPADAALAPTPVEDPVAGNPNQYPAGAKLLLINLSLCLSVFLAALVCSCT